MALDLMGDGTDSFAMLLCGIVMEQRLGLVHDTAIKGRPAEEIG